MRVVIVSDFGLVNGGAAKVAIESARGLAEAGVEVVFAFAIGPPSERLNHPKITLERFDEADIWAEGPTFSAARRGIWNRAAEVFLIALFARQPADTIVHLHQWTKAFSPAAIGAAGVSKLPLFITVHDYFSFCPVGGYFDFQAAKPCQVKPMSWSCMVRNCDKASYTHKLVRVARQWRSNQALRLCQDITFVHVSEFAHRFAQPFLPAHSRHVTVENMTDVAMRPPIDASANKHALFLGRFTQEKAPDLVAAAALAANMRVRFVGEGPLAESIKRINPQADVIGWMSNDAVFAEIAAARCVVVPSIWFETGPLVVAEARAVGVPVILARTTGAASWIDNGKDGILIDGNDIAQLTTALIVFRDDETVRDLGLEAHRRYWADPLTIERHVARTQAAYAKSGRDAERM